MKSLAYWYQRLQHRLDHWWYVPTVAGLAAINAFLPFIPVEIFVVLRVLVRPREWWRTPVVVAGASAVGAIVLALLVGHDPDSPIAHFLSRHLGEKNWLRAETLLREHGALGMGIISASFIPQQPAIVAGALSGMPVWKIAMPIWIARSLKYGLWSALAAYAPHWILSEEHHQQIKSRRG